MHTYNARRFFSLFSFLYVLVFQLIDGFYELVQLLAFRSKIFFICIVNKLADIIEQKKET